MKKRIGSVGKEIFAVESGTSLVLALVVTSLLFSLVAIVISFTNTELQSAFKQEKRSAAYYIAEAGVERAVHEINLGLSRHALDIERINRDLHHVRFYDENGFFSVQIAEKENASKENIGYTIRSEGHYQGEQETIVAWVRQPVGRPHTKNFAVFAEEELQIRTLSDLLFFHQIRIDGDVHGNNRVELKHVGILIPGTPQVNGVVSSTNLANIKVDGLSDMKKAAYPYMPIPLFEFDKAREMAKKEGIYVPHSVTSISLLGLSPTDKIIFIEGDLVLTGLDLLGIALQDRTIVVNGNITGLLEVGGNTFVRTRLNLIAKENITFLGAVTGLQVNGILFAQGMDRQTNEFAPGLGRIEIAGHAEVEGYMAGRKIDIGGGVLSGLLGLITGNMHFSYDPQAFQSFPSGVGFKQNYVEVVEQRVSGA